MKISFTRIVLALSFFAFGGGAMKAQSVLLDSHSSSGGSQTWSITTTYANELILVSAGGCCGTLSSSPGTVTVNGNNATYINGTNAGGSFPTTIWAYVAATPGTYSLYCTESGMGGPWVFNFAAAVYCPSGPLTVGDVSASAVNANVGFLSISAPITTVANNSLVYGFMIYNDNAGSGTINWQGGLTELDHYFIANGVDGAHADSTYALAGTYTLKVTDTGATNPYASLTVVAVQPTSCKLTAKANVISNVSCSGGSNGSASVSDSAGTKPYTYSWSTAPIQTTDTASGLSAGTYTVTVTDSIGCSATASITITAPPVLNAYDTAASILVCKGTCTVIDAGASGGSPAYKYAWNTGATTSSITACPTSNTSYTTVVTDANGCASSASTTINVIALPVVSAHATKDSACVTITKDSLIGSPAGGTFSGTGVTGANFDPKTAGAGVYFLTYKYTDTATGCSDTAAIKVIVNVCTGINELNADQQIQLYPNPFSLSVNVNVSVDGPVTITIFNMLGENVGSWVMGKGLNTINTAAFTSGVYTVQIKSKDGLSNKKLIKIN